jgi:repressor LexA
MTPTQARVLSAIKRLTTDNGVSPSYDELVEACNLSSKSRVREMVARLAEDGYVRWTPGRARSIQIIDRTTVDPEIAATAAFNAVACARRDGQPVTKASLYAAIVEAAGGVA